jgi:hypothetical protein
VLLGGGGGKKGLAWSTTLLPTTKLTFTATTWIWDPLGRVILPDQKGQYPHLGIIAGKEGMIYLVNRDNLGHYNSIGDQVVQEPFDPNRKMKSTVALPIGTMRSTLVP